jgi:predicted nucleotidyltransferase
MGRDGSYARAWRRRWDRQRRDDEAAAAAGLELASRLARLLRDHHGARRVVLFGSLARGDFRVGSDIDLAAEGIPPDRFFRAGADLDAAAGEVHVDLLPLESAGPRARAAIAAEGVVLHDADAA